MEMNGKWVQFHIENHRVRRQEMIRMYKNYQGKQLAIEDKEVSKTQKANNKLKNDFRGYIVDQQNGYFLGKPISFGLDDTNYQDLLYKGYYREMQRYLTRNNFDDLIAEIDKISRVCGYCGLLNYITSEGNEKFIIKAMRINPWEVVFVEENGVTIPIYYYSTLVEHKGKMVTRTKANVYTDTLIYYYMEDKDGNFQLVNDSQLESNPLLHGFDFNPLEMIENNDELLGDFEKVENLIDTYDKTVSTMQDEIEQFANAYLMITGLTLDEETLTAIKESGAFSGLEPEDKVEFITKQINDAYIQNQLDALFDNILMFSASINMQDEAFGGGAESGVARAWRLLALENKAIIKERKMSKSLRNMFKAICSAWNKVNINIDYLDIYFNFSRNVPLDLLYLAEISQKFKGFISEDTRLALLSAIIDDIEWEKRKMKEDSSINLDEYDSQILNPSKNEEVDE